MNYKKNDKRLYFLNKNILIYFISFIHISDDCQTRRTYFCYSIIQYLLVTNSPIVSTNLFLENIDFLRMSLINRTINVSSNKNFDSTANLLL